MVFQLYPTSEQDDWMWPPPAPKDGELRWDFNPRNQTYYVRRYYAAKSQWIIRGFVAIGHPANRLHAWEAPLEEYDDLIGTFDDLEEAKGVVETIVRLEG